MLKHFLCCALILLAPASLASSLLGYWNFKDGIIDVSPNSTYSYGNDVYLEKSPFNNASLFNGVSSYLSAANSQALQLGNGSFSISVWIKPTASSGTNTVVSKIDENGPGFELSIESTANLGWTVNAQITDQQGNQVNCSGCGSLYNFGEWHHVGLVYDINELRLYVDGNLDATVSGPTLGSINSVNDLLVGAYMGTSGTITNSFLGTIDELKILDNVLTTAGIMREVDLINQQVYAPTVGAVSMTDGTGSTYQRNTVYRASSDTYVSFYQAGSGCDRNFSTLQIGASANDVTMWVGRAHGYNGASFFVARDEFWQVNHSTRYSSCNVFIQTRTLN